MDEGLREVSAQDGHDNEVSGPLEFRRLQGNKRCARCKEVDRDCYLERRKPGQLHCVTCRVPGDCRFQRLVIKEGDASTFSWQELIGDDVAAAPTYPTTAGAISRKRPYTAITNSYHEPSPSQYALTGRHHAAIPSSTSEPGSQIPTNLSISPFGTRKTHRDYRPRPHYIAPNIEAIDLRDAGALFKPDSSGQLQFDPSLFDPYVPENLSYQDGQSSVNQDFHQLTDQLQNLFPEPQQVVPEDPMRQSQSHFQSQNYQVTPPKVQRLSTSTLPDAKGQPLQLQCPTCHEQLNTNSEYRKHMARHTKPFVCDVTGCARTTDGFATRNDLERHKGSVHDSKHAPKMYKCSVPGCRDPHKVWSRKDNFKAHIRRMHPGVDADESVEKFVVDADTADKP